MRGGVFSKRIDTGCLNKIILLGVAAIWDHRKGVDDFVKLSEVLSADYKIVMIGLNDNQISSMPNSILKIKKTNNVKELAEWYSMADFFINPTYQDNYPTVNLEAQACGTPVITYKTGGSSEAINDTSGWVIEQGDIEAIKQIILKNEEKIKYIGACIAQSKAFDRKERYIDYINLYFEKL